MSTQGEPMDLSSDTDPQKTKELTQEERVFKLWDEFDRAASSDASTSQTS